MPPTHTPPAADTAPPGHVFVLYFRRTRSEPWAEVCRHQSAEALWLRSLEMPSGHYRESLIRTDLFDWSDRAAG